MHKVHITEELTCYDSAYELNQKLLVDVEKHRIETNHANTRNSYANDSMDISTLISFLAEAAHIRQHIHHLQQLLQDTHDAIAKNDIGLREDQSTLERLKSHVDELDAQNTKLIAENRTLQETVQSTNNAVQERNDRIATLTEELTRVSTRTDELQKKLQVVQDVESLNIREFEAMMASNMQITQNIQRLMQSFAQMRSSTAPSDPTVPDVAPASTLGDAS